MASRARREALVTLARAPSVARTGGFSFQSTGGKELNFADFSWTANDIPVLGDIFLLNGLVLGTSASQRIGRRIKIRSIEVRVAVASTGPSDQFRMMIVQDRQANAATPAFTDIYDTTAPVTLRNISNKARFKVVHDFGLSFVAGSGLLATSPEGDGSIRTFEFYKKVGIPVQYNAGNAGTVGDIQTNALYFVTISSSGNCNLGGRCRLRYSDD